MFGRRDLEDSTASEHRGAAASAITPPHRYSSTPLHDSFLPSPYTAASAGETSRSIQESGHPSAASDHHHLPSSTASLHHPPVAPSAISGDNAVSIQETGPDDATLPPSAAASDHHYPATPLHDDSSPPSPYTAASAKSDGETSRSIQESGHPSAASDHHHLVSLHNHSSLLSPHTSDTAASVNASHHSSALAAVVRSPLEPQLRADITTDPSPSTQPEAAPSTPATPTPPPQIGGIVLALGGYAFAGYMWAVGQRRRRPRQLQDSDQHHPTASATSLHDYSSWLSPHTPAFANSASVNASHHSSALAAAALSPLETQLRADIHINPSQLRKLLERIRKILDRIEQRKSGSPQSPSPPTDPSPPTPPPPSPWAPTLTATCRWIGGAVLAFGGYAFIRYMWDMWQRRRRRPRQLLLQRRGGFAELLSSSASPSIAHRRAAQN